MAKDIGKDITGLNTLPPGIRHTWNDRRITAIYTYKNEAGNTIGHTARYDDNSGKVVIPSFIFKEEKWKEGAHPEPRPLYGLDRLAKNPGSPVLIVEGEKTADAADRLVGDKYVVLTWQGGCPAVKQADWAVLKDRRIVIWPDADDPGRKAANEVAYAAIHAEALSVAVVKLPSEVEEKWDLADAKDKGWTGKQVNDWITSNAVDFELEPKTTATIQGITASDLLNMEFPEPRWAVDGILPEGLNILAGKPKHGKSIMALNIALSIALGGRALMAIPVDPGAVVYLALEDIRRRLQSRIRQMMTGTTGKPDLLKLFTAWPRMDDGGVEELDNLLGNTNNVRLLIIDTWAKFRPPARGNGNSYDDDYQAVNRVKELADRHGVSILLIHHLRKMAALDVFDNFSGTLGLTGAADGLLALTKTPSGGTTLHVTGRDVEPAELALEFDPVILSWRLIGNADEVQVFSVVIN